MSFDGTSFEGIRQELDADNLTLEEKNLVKTLSETGQEHLFSDWSTAGEDLDRKKALLGELLLVNSSYPGGIPAYVANARKLLADACSGSNQFDGYYPEQPDTVDLTSIDDEYSGYEALAMENLDKIAVVLVAGGLGERLGYPGIKLDIPVEVLMNTTYLQHYASVIRAMEMRMKDPSPVPLVIMTSRDTHEKTEDTLRKNNCFGLSRDQVTVLKQELVPAISDNEGHIAMNGPYSVTLKPHGHGDIHMLLHTSGTAQDLYDRGIRWLLFIQDTNGQVFNAAFAAIGASIKHDFDFNSVAVNRIPGEAVGALTKLVKDASEKTLNVEYNQLDALLRATISPDGDVPGEKGFSVFPGNINVLVAKLESYKDVLCESGGIIAEFVNPKYSDDSRTTFRKPTRLETMMQDLPRLFNGGEKVGVTIFDREWCFSANKNNLEDARKKYEQGGPPESAATAESDFYKAGRTKLLLAGAEIEETEQELMLGIPFIRGPRVVLSPDFALTVEDVRRKIRNVRLSGETTLVLKGENINVNGLSMSDSSALVVQADQGAHVNINGAEISNKGYELVPLDGAHDAPEYLKIRGYRLEDRGAMICSYDKPGDYTVPSSS